MTTETNDLADLARATAGLFELEPSELHPDDAEALAAGGLVEVELREAVLGYADAGEGL